MTEAALQLLREYFKSQILYARYLVGSQWIRTEITDVDILESGHVSATFEIQPGAETLHVTQTALYGQNDTLLVQQEANIIRQPDDDRLFFNMRIKIYTA